jgi:hypothetical protein
MSMCLEDKLWRRQLAGTVRSESYPVTGFGICGVKSSDSVATMLVYYMADSDYCYETEFFICELNDV